MELLRLFHSQLTNSDIKWEGKRLGFWWWVVFFVVVVVYFV